MTTDNRGAVAETTGEIVITPRVLDQAAYDDLAAMLQALIGEAGAAAGTLRQGLGESSKASASLQERLKVSVRMLKALQLQLDGARAHADELARQRRRVEQAVEEAEDRLGALLDRAEALSRLVESAEVNIAVAAHRAAART